MATKKILLLGSQHGDEVLGDSLYSYVKVNHPDLLPSLDFKIANPKAHKLGKRFVESDMNRSYVGRPKTYEQRKARELIKYIDERGYDLVLDLHTTGCKQPPCIIVEGLYVENKQFIDASSTEEVVLMQHKIVRQALNGHRRQAVSIEANRNSVSQALLEELCQDITRYLSAQKAGTTKNYYRVFELLAKNELDDTELKKLKNFELSNNGFYPVLVGENSYKRNTNYLGFKAEKVGYNEENE